MGTQDVVDQVLAAWRGDARQVRCEYLAGAGGFSGAQLWRVELVSPPQALCLRRWPDQQQDIERLREIHRAQHWAARQLPFVPLLCATPAGETLVAADGAWWELAAWLPGAANYHQRPSEQKLIAALHAVARLHLCWGALAATDALSSSPPPAIVRRLERLTWLETSGIAAIRKALADGPAIADAIQGLPLRAVRLLTLFEAFAPALRQQLTRAVHLTVPLQTCLRDIWCEHVLFSGDNVTGIVDYGALGVDTVAADVARLLGSLARDDAEAWQTGLKAYQEHRLLSVDEVALVAACDFANALLSGMNWLVWLLVEQRHFENHANVLARIDESLARMEYRKQQSAIWYPE